MGRVPALELGWGVYSPLKIANLVRLPNAIRLFKPRGRQIVCLFLDMKAFCFLVAAVIDQMMLTPTKFQLAQERSLKYLGTAKVYINRIVPHPSISRELDPKNVERLSEVFSHDGCRRLDIRNHVTAVVSRQHLAVALQTAGVTTRSLKTSPLDQYPLLEFSVGQIQCLHGQHRLVAAKEQLPPPEQWWTVDLYLDGTKPPTLSTFPSGYSRLFQLLTNLVKILVPTY
jgi:hypothetical protein